MKEDYSQGFTPRRFEDNPLEKKFAEMWVQRNEQGKILQYLTSPDNDPRNSTMSGRDKIIAGCVIQWLGSPVGRGFLRDVLGSDCGA